MQSKLNTWVLVAIIALGAPQAIEAQENPALWMTVEIRENHSGYGLAHDVYVDPLWVRPGSVRGTHFGAPITPADLMVWVPRAGESIDAECRYLSGFIQWNVDGFTRLNRPDEGDAEDDQPVSKITKFRAAYLARPMTCTVDSRISKRQPAGIRTFECRSPIQGG